MTRTARNHENGIVHDQRGTTTVEFALITSVFFMFFFGIIDFGIAFWEMNSAAKAVQVGVRFAVVNDPVSDAVNFDGTAAGILKGDPVPIADFNGGNPVVECTWSGGAASCDAGTADDAAFMAIVTTMQQFYGKIQPENVVIRMEHVGLGFSGSPFGSSIDPMVTVRVQGVTFNPITPGISLLAPTITMPPRESSQLAEDMES